MSETNKKDTFRLIGIVHTKEEKQELISIMNVAISGINIRNLPKPHLEEQEVKTGWIKRLKFW